MWQDDEVDLGGMGGKFRYQVLAFGNAGELLASDRVRFLVLPGEDL